MANDDAFAIDCYDDSTAVEFCRSICGTLGKIEWKSLSTSKLHLVCVGDGVVESDQIGSFADLKTIFTSKARKKCQTTITLR